MEVAAAVIHVLRMKRFNECEHTEFREPPASENPKPDEVQCCGCTAIANPENWAKVKASKKADKERAERNAQRRVDQFSCPKCSSGVNTRHGNGERVCGDCSHRYRVEGY